MPQTSAATNLIAAARCGDALALDRLWQLFRQYLRLLARTGIDASLQGKADPSDLVQETLLRATQHFPGFRGETEAELAAWLRQILSQALTDLVRRYRTASRQVGRERSIAELLEGSSLSLGSMFGREAKEGGLISSDRDAGVLLAEALAEMNSDDREVITLRNLERLEWQQVAAKMGRSTDAARMLWMRALRRLRPIIEKHL
jgi:RNA polymerase sigma-70 factor (ECF subfamily)